MDRDTGGASERRHLRTTFDAAAELYDRARPVYPARLFDDLVGLAELSPQGRILEVGCGTGQGTHPLAERGFRITCVELGAALAALARRKLAAFPEVEVVTAPFETWQPTEDAGFDAVVAFTALHWVDPELRYRKPAALLGERGALAVVSTQHVLPDDGDPFFADVQEDYEAILPDDPKTKAGAPPLPDAVPGLAGEIEASGVFRHVAERRYLWDASYTADDYLALLDTYSRHRALDDETRGRLYARIRSRIEARTGGRVRKTYLATLDVSRLL